MRYFLELSYKGTAYCGWQIQQNAPSVQQTIEQALSKILRQPVEIVGCGRTDTGVHAAFYIAHFETENAHVTEAKFRYHLNCILPHDIAIHNIYQTELHARFDAKYREYKYYISCHKSPFNTDGSWLLTTALDVELMQEGAQILAQYKDFASMCRVGSDNKSTLCDIYEMRWERKDDMLIFTVAANRFLRGMVRALVGTLVEVGRGKIKPEALHQIMMAANRGKAGSAAPAQALFLTDIKYK